MVSEERVDDDKEHHVRLERLEIDRCFILTKAYSLIPQPSL